MARPPHIHTPDDEGLVVRVSEKVQRGQVWLHPDDAVGRERVLVVAAPPPSPVRRARLTDDEVRERNKATVAELLEKRRRCPHRFGDSNVCPDCGESRPRL
jgi:hypothetical protein